MIEIRNMLASLVAVVLVATSTLQGGDATEYIVGKTSGWVVPHERNDFYNHWAQEFKFKVGDVLVFNFVKGMHDVFEVTKEDYEACEAKKPIATMVEGPAKIKLHSSGNHYFICTFPGHCKDGQRLEVKVGGTSSPASSPAAAASSPVATAPSPKKASHSSHHGHAKSAETPKSEDAPSEAPTPESTKDSSGEAPSPSNTEAPSEAPTPEANSEAPTKEHTGSHSESPSHGTAGAPSEQKHKNLHGVKHDVLKSQDLQGTRPLLKL